MIACENAFPTKIIFGKGTRKEIGRRLKEYTDQVLFIYGGGSIKRTGLYDEITGSFKENGIRFCAMHYLRFAPAFYHGAKLVREGRIGKPQMVTAQKSYVFGTRPTWYKDPMLYGGTIPWVGIHAIDWISFFSGKRFQSVTAQSIGQSPEMAALCQFAMEDGVIASANLDFYRPNTAPTHGDDRVRCVGTEGVLEVKDGKILLMNKDGVSEFSPHTAPELLTAFLDGEDPLPAAEIFHLTKTAIAARESAKSGKTLFIGD